MNRSSAHRMLALLTIAAALCLVVVACGGTTDATRSASLVASSASIAPSPRVTGDYDGDDDYADERHSDGDNDDVTRNLDRDGDSSSDNQTHSYFDSDDSVVRSSAHPAGAPDRRSIVDLVTRYFAAATAGDGAMACPMIVPSFAKAVPENLGGPAGPGFARGTTCAGVLSKVFVHYHRQLAAHEATLRVSNVRVDRDGGLAVLAFKNLPPRQVRLLKQGGIWRMDDLLDSELP